MAAAASGSGSGAAESKAPTMEQLIERKAYGDLFNACQQRELEEAGAPPKNVDASINNLTLQLASALLLGDKDNARFLWKRIATDYKKRSKELGAVWKVGQQMWKRDAKGFYAAATGFAWSKNVKTLMDALIDSTRDKYTALIAKAYSSIKLEDCADSFGLAPPQAQKYVSGLGWRVDKNMVYPLQPPASKGQQVSLEQLKQLTDYVVHLESR